MYPTFNSGGYIFSSYTLKEMFLDYDSDQLLDPDPPVENDWFRPEETCFEGQRILV